MLVATLAGGCGAVEAGGSAGTGRSDPADGGVDGTASAPALGLSPPAPPTGLDGSNEAYRRRSSLPPEYEARAQEHLARIDVELRAAEAAGPLDAAAAQALLAGIGYDVVQSYGRSDAPGGLAVGVGTDAGCVYGGVRGTEVLLETGGGIADGGCLPAEGH
jgi:hypothetical protein